MFKKNKRHDSESERHKSKAEKHVKTEPRPRPEGHKKLKKEVEDKSRPPDVHFLKLNRPKSVSSNAEPTGQEYICPSCSLPDDGSPMIQCERCDAWFHLNLICVGIQEAPKDDDSWYCQRCSKKANDGSSKKKKHKKH